MGEDAQVTDTVDVGDAPVADTVTEAPIVDAVADVGDDWRAVLPEDIRNHQSIQETKSVEALAKRFLDNQSFVGASIRVPGKDASPEDMAKFQKSLLDKNVGLMLRPDVDDVESITNTLKMLGTPEEVTEYARPENWTGVDDERFNLIAETALESGLTKGQFEKLTTKLAAVDNEVIAEMQQARDMELTQLKGEWGNAYDQKTSRAAIVAKQLEMPSDIQEALAEGTNVPANVYRWLDKMAERFGGEGNNALVKEVGTVSEHTPTELKERFAEITKRLLSMDQSDPQYQALNQKRLKYMEMLHPTAG